MMFHHVPRLRRMSESKTLRLRSIDDAPSGRNRCQFASAHERISSDVLSRDPESNPSSTNGTNTFPIHCWHDGLARVEHGADDNGILYCGELFL
jgi:hypothetical protein